MAISKVPFASSMMNYLLFHRRLPLTNGRLVFALAALAAFLLFSACGNGGRLPDKSSKEYRDFVSAFYVGLAALQISGDVRAQEKLALATQLVPQEPAAWANLGLLALRQQELDVAAERLEKARTLAPENSRIWALLGLVESRRGKLAEAIAHLRKASELDAKNLRAIYALAQEIERQGGEQNEAEVQRLMEKILAAQPDNLAALLELARIAAKRGDAETLRTTVARVAERAAAWPSEAQQQVSALQAAAAGPNTRSAGSQVAVLKNVLVRVPEYRQSLAAVKAPTGEIGEPFTRFVKLPPPDPAPAPADNALTFAKEPLPAAGAGKWEWVGAISLNDEGPPAVVVANGREVHLANGQTLSFPGGPSSISPGPDGILALDFNYDFKTDLALAGAGGLRLFQQEASGSFTDVTARTTLPGGVTKAAYIGAWAMDVDLDGDLDIVLGAREGPPLVARNNGDGTFREVRPFEGVKGLSRLFSADIDGDGDPDVAMMDSERRLHVFINRHR